jgi:hypothetical protein
MRRDFMEGSPIWRFRRAWVFMQVGMILTLCTVDVWDTALSYVFFLLGSGVWLLSVQPDANIEENGAEREAAVAGRAGVRYTRFAGRGARPATAITAQRQ